MQPCLVSGHPLSSPKSCPPRTWRTPQQECCLVADWNALIGGLDDTSQRHVPLLCASSALPSPQFLLPPNFRCQGHTSRTAEDDFSFVSLAQQTGKHQPVTEGSHWWRDQLWWFQSGHRALWVSSLLYHPRNEFSKPDIMLHICCHWLFFFLVWSGVCVVNGTLPFTPL